jgi:cell division topological specificity factor
MNLFKFLRRGGSAPVARERLQILLAPERTSFKQPDLLAILREEILAVIATHVTVDRDNVQVTMERGDNVSTLEIDVEVPNASGLLVATGA